MAYSEWIQAGQLYYRAKARARSRGIEFRLTREQWVNIWVQALGPDWRKKRGQHRGQYSMTRFQDRGPYAIGNVEIKLSTENVAEAARARAKARAVLAKSKP